MNILKFVAIPLCLLLVGCGGIGIPTSSTVTSEMIQGEWVEDVKWRPGDQKPEKPSRFIVHADGTLEVYNIPMMMTTPTSLVHADGTLETYEVSNRIVSKKLTRNPPSVSGTAKWSLEHKESQIFRVSWPKEMSPPNGFGAEGYFSRESGKLIVWFYIGDPDLYDRVVFVKK